MERLKVKAVIFDLGCTLIEYEAYSWDEMAREAIENGHTMLRKKGIAVPDLETFHTQYVTIRDQFRKQSAEALTEWSIPRAVRLLFERLEIAHDDDLVERFFDAYYEPVEKSLFLYDDALATLEIIRERFPTLGLVSNTIFPERAHQKELKRFGINHLFDFEIYSSSFGFRKPRPEIFYQAANRAGYAPSECVYIGDRYQEDILGPTSVGMAGILKLKDGREYPEKMPEAFAEIRQLAELTEILEN
jgi:putative hydrolase of the HAD superfamily